MQIKRSATAHWAGSGKDGKGTLSSASGVLSEAQYGFKSRFEDGIGTNPEELIAAAHSGCFSMKLAFNLQAENFQGRSPDASNVYHLAEIRCRVRAGVHQPKALGYCHQ